MEARRRNACPSRTLNAGLDGFEVLAAADAGGELEMLVQTTADVVGCPEWD